MSGASTIGGGIQTVANLNSLSDKKMNSYKESIFYDNQANYLEEVGKRKLYLLDQDQQGFINRQRSMLSKAGISMSGSALDVMAGEKVDMKNELAAVKSQTQYEVDITRSRANNAREEASAYGQAGIITAVTGIIGSGANELLFSSNHPESVGDISSSGTRSGGSPILVYKPGGSR